MVGSGKVGGSWLLGPREWELVIQWSLRGNRDLLGSASRARPPPCIVLYNLLLKSKTKPADASTLRKPTWKAIPGRNKGGVNRAYNTSRRTFCVYYPY
ncbi:hypothetical protein VTK56DRAFT_7861 [Thermocarpiscus australiensis]